MFWRSIKVFWIDDLVRSEANSNTVHALSMQSDFPSA